MALSHEIARRRTFAIVSHPDAGKTTLTEKFLLYGGAVQLAGSVTARKSQRATASDWMALERQRGISISSTVLQFEYQGYRINLLDTPGHQDFSEDTYRVLTAVDAAVMVIDAGKGIEQQTIKLFEVCRRRGVPIFTFMNKMDRPARDPLELIDELESVLGIGASPMNWPLGAGPSFKGVYERQTRLAHLFERTPLGAFRAPVVTSGLDDPQIRSQLTPEAYRTVCEEVELLDISGAEFDPAAVLAGEVSPVYFGSAVNSFGVQLLLDGFLQYSAPPAPRLSEQGLVAPDSEAFSGFVFKIQANMDPRHRDRIAFVRVVSGTFTRDMAVLHANSGKKVRLSNAQRLFGRERETIDVAYPGDVVGLVSNAQLAIGDTLTEDPAICYHEVPRFTPECFTYLQNTQPSNYKRFRDGLEQLLQEGVVQSFTPVHMTGTMPLLAAAGPLQFEIVQYRLESEYGAETRLESAPWTVVRWSRLREGHAAADVPSGVLEVNDRYGQRALLFTSEWRLRHFAEEHPGLELSAFPFDETPAELASV